MISRVFCLWITLFLGSITANGVVSEARHHRPSAVIVGTVYCDSCFHQDFSQASHFISGASVAVECGERSKGRPSFRQEVKTDDRGEFKAQLPFSVSKSAKKIRECSVKLISSGEPGCAVAYAAAAAATSSIHLKARKEGTHVFSAGSFSFRPNKQPEFCNLEKKTDAVNSPASNLQLAPILPPIPGIPGVPELPGQLPVPPIGPGNPLIPPAAPMKLKTEQVEPNIFPPFGVVPPIPFLPPPILPPNPLLPPPSIIPPVIPSPPPSIFPPIFPSPPPSIFPPVFPSPPSPPPSIFPPFPLPPIPGITPSPPPPTPSSSPVLPFPLPPFPFQPSPGSPPPAVTSSTARKNP